METEIFLIAQATTAAVEAAASASAAPAFNFGAWLGALSNPLVSGLIVAVLTQGAKALPKIPTDTSGKIAAVAAILSIIVGFLAAWTNGALDSFSFDAAYAILVNSLTTLLAGMGTYEAAKRTTAAFKVGN